MFRILGRLWPDAGAHLAYRIWFQVHKVPEPQRERPWREAAQQSDIQFDRKRVHLYRWGTQGPLVVLMHGWGGRGPQLGAFVSHLNASGFRVLAIDAPGHGQSSGDRTSLPEVAQALRYVVEQEGGAHAVIAHSFGSMVAQQAIRDGMSVDAVVSIGAPCSVGFLVEKFKHGLGLNDAIADRFTSRFERDFGKDLWQRFSPKNLVPRSGVRALIVHDRDDNDVDFPQGELLQRSWPEARSLWTRKLGHWRILRDETVIEHAVAFIQESEGVSGHAD